MKTNPGKASEQVKDQAAFMSDMADAMRKNCEQALHTSLKFQEEASRWWSSVYNPGTCAQQWQQQVNSATRVANSMLPLAQKPMSELIDLVEKNSRAGAELVKQAIDAAQSPVLSESQSKWTELWTDSLGAMRSNTEALAQIGAKAIDSWASFVRENAQATDLRGARTA